jgi:hypothetical protein
VDERKGKEKVGFGCVRNSSGLVDLIFLICIIKLEGRKKGGLRKSRRRMSWVLK